MNNSIKRIVPYGLVNGLIFAVFMTAITYWISNKNLLTAVEVGLAGGFLSGITHSLLGYKFSVPKYILDAVSVDIDTDETIKFQSPANYISSQEPVSGKLFLTNKRLVFRNHDDKHQLEFSINLIDIATVDTFKASMPFKNGLSTQTTSGVTHKFIVDRLEEWITQLNK